MPRTLEEIDTALETVETNTTAHGEGITTLTEGVSNLSESLGTESGEREKLAQEFGAALESLAADIEELNRTLDLQVGEINALKNRVTALSEGIVTPEEEAPVVPVFPTFTYQNRQYRFKAANFRVDGNDYVSAQVVLNTALRDRIVSEYPGLFEVIS